MNEWHTASDTCNGNMCTFLRCCIWEESEKQSTCLWEEQLGFCGSRGFPLLQYQAACVRREGGREGRRERKKERHNRETESMLLPGNSGKTLSNILSISPVIIHFPRTQRHLESVTRACFSLFSYFPAATDSPSLTRQFELSVLTNALISREASSQAENINMCWAK